MLARAAGTDYRALVEQRILQPLRMAATGFEEIEVVPGYRKGESTPAWTFRALEGAGALRSTAADMLTFAEAFFEPPETALGEAMVLARKPVHHGRFGIGSVGLGWLIRPSSKGPARDTTWHNGGTFGGASFVALDVEERTAVVTFGNEGPRLTGPLDSPSWALFDSLVHSR